MKRSRVRSKRATPRRRTAPRWSADEWEAADWQLRTRAHHSCEVCGRLLGNHAERHHRQRRRDGGDRLANLLLLHPGCHKHVTEHPEEARENGWIVPVGTDPETVPVRLYDGTYVYLHDDGTCTLTRTPA